MESLVINVLQKVNGKTYYPNTGDLEQDVRQCSRLLQEFPDSVRGDRSQYSTLQRFFSILNEKTGMWEYEHYCCGAQSPYIIPLGW